MILIYLVTFHIIFISSGLLDHVFLFDHLIMIYIAITIGFFHYVILIIGSISIY
jgi:hypothetical protein